MGQIKYFLKEYWFWLAVTFVHRLLTIMQPPLEVAHNWRQTTVNMVARNFLEVDANIFFPRVDMAGELSGITGMEFPLLNYLIYLVSLVFGYEHWYGRLINLIVTTLGLWCFYDYLKRHFNQRIAFNTGMVLLFSLFYYYSRKIMPDTFSISLVFMSIWYFQRFVAQNKLRDFFLALFLVFVGVASKLPAVISLIFLWPTFRIASIKQKSMMVTALIIAGSFSGWWYFIWVPHLELTYGAFGFFIGENVLSSFQFLVNQWGNTLKMVFVKPLGISGMLVFLPGLYFAFKSKFDVKFITIGSIILFGLFMLYSGDRFGEHEYYVFPIIPLFSLLAGLALNQFKNWIYVFILTVLCVDGIVRKWEDQFVKNDAGLIGLEQVIDSVSLKDDLVVVNSGVMPTPLYFTHRKGWLASNSDLQDETFVRDLQSKGCSFIIILKKRFGEAVDLSYSKVYDSAEYSIYKI